MGHSIYSHASLAPWFSAHWGPRGEKQDNHVAAVIASSFFVTLVSLFEAPSKTLGLDPPIQEVNSGRGGVFMIMHGRSRTAIDPRIPTYNSGAEHVGVFTDQAGICLHHARSET